MKKVLVLAMVAAFAVCVPLAIAEDAPADTTISEEVVYEGEVGDVDCSDPCCDPCCVAPCRPLLGRLFCRRAYCVDPCVTYCPPRVCAPRVCAPRVCAPRIYNPCPPCPPRFGCFGPRAYCAPVYCAPVVYAPVYVRPYYYGCCW